MTESVTLITRQFLAWVADRPRTRTEVREAWRSCPRIAVWEDSVIEGLVKLEPDGAIVLTPRGRKALNGAAETDH